MAEKEPPFDRNAYLKEIREGLLRKLGLPENTKPHQVEQLLKIREEMNRLNKPKGPKH